MNLFRSEEHVTGWSFFKPDSYQSILPVRDWVYVMGATVFSRRFEADYLDGINHDTMEHLDDFFERLSALGRSGGFWKEEGPFSS